MGPLRRCSRGLAMSRLSAKAARSSRRSSTGVCAKWWALACLPPSDPCSISGWGDLIDYLGDDPNTQSIVIYMETIGDARAFLSAAREVALNKPIIVIKPGRSQEAGARRGVPYRFFGRTRRCARGGLPARGRPARGPHFRPFLYGRRFSANSRRPNRPAPDDCDECRRARRPGHGCPDRRRRQLAPLSSGDPSEPRTTFFRRPGATTIRSTFWATRPPERYAKRWRSARRSATAMAPGHSHSASHDRRYENRAERWCRSRTFTKNPS